MSTSIDLSAVRRLYRDGVNVIEHLRGQLGGRLNTEQLVETSYDLQAGTYVEYVTRHPELCVPYQQDVARVLDSCIEAGDSVADIGTGEMTTLAPVAEACYVKVSTAYALDISLSRLLVGKHYLQDRLAAVLAAKVQPVAASLFQLPFADAGIDVVWTSHALEPNGGREREALVELARVCRKRLVLFEPSYENNSAEGRQRMDRLGYVKGLKEILESLPDIELEQVLRIDTTENALNPSYAHIARRKRIAPRRASELHCPLSHGPLERRDGYCYARSSLLAYPVIAGVPVLRVDKGICASILDVGAGS